MGITVPVALARSRVSFLHSPSTKFSIPWVSLECSLTALLTLLIVGRILYVVHDMKAQGVHLHSDYTGVVAILVEAAIPLSLSGMVFAVCIARNLAATVPFACIWGLLVVRTSLCNSVLSWIDYKPNFSRPLLRNPLFSELRWAVLGQRISVFSRRPSVL